MKILNEDAYGIVWISNGCFFNNLCTRAWEEGRAEAGDGHKRGISFRMADVKPGWDRNRSSGFSDRPNQCKQLDIAGNISFLRAALRSTAKRAQTTTTTGVEGSRDARAARRSECRRKTASWEGGKKKRKRIPVVGESLPCHSVPPRRSPQARSHPPTRRLRDLFSLFYARASHMRFPRTPYFLSGLAGWARLLAGSKKSWRNGLIRVRGEEFLSAALRKVI